jgi:hypothetical protein
MVLMQVAQHLDHLTVQEREPRLELAERYLQLLEGFENETVMVGRIFPRFQDLRFKDVETQHVSVTRSLEKRTMIGDSQISLEPNEVKGLHLA